MIEFAALNTPNLVLVLLLMALPILPNLWSIWHAYFRTFKTDVERLIWLGICVFVPVLGGLVYIIFGRPRGRKADVVPAGQPGSPAPTASAAPPDSTQE